MTNTELLVALIAVAVVVLGGGAALLVRRGRGELPPPRDLDAITEEYIEHPEHPEPHLPSEDEEPPFEEVPADEKDQPTAPTTTVERPEPAQGRLVRLRARLARSNSSLGRGLLAVLGRADLDDAAWEELELSLIHI